MDLFGEINIEGLTKIIEDQNDEIKSLEEFISVYIKKDKLTSNITELQDKFEETSNKLNLCQQAIRNYQNNTLVEYENLSKKIRMQQLTVLNILMELKKRKKCKAENKNNGLLKNAIQGSILKNKNGPSAVKQEQFSTNKKVLIPQCETPKMYLNDYLASPYTRKIRPIPFQFLDFEFNITCEMFETIPKYMRGRETVDELRNFFNKTIVVAFNEKYQLMHRQREFVRNLQEIELWKMYHNQSSLFPELKFITEDDLCRKTNKILDKKSKNRITMIKHLAILQEQRNGKIVCYIWIASSWEK